MKNIIILITIIILCLTDIKCQNVFCYNINDNTLALASKLNNEGEEYWTGVGPEGIKIFAINNADSVLLFKSFGCTQFYYSNNKVNRIELFVWPNNFNESDCLCAGNDGNPCKPDRNLADLKIFFVFEKGRTVCRFSKLIPQNIFHKKNIKEKLKSLKFTKIINLDTITNTNSSIYNSTVSLCGFFIENYYDIATYCLFNKMGEISTVDSLINLNLNYIKKANNWSDDNEILTNYNYDKNLIKYLLPMCGRTFINEEIIEVNKNINNLYKALIN